MSEFKDFLGGILSILAIGVCFILFFYHMQTKDVSASIDFFDIGVEQIAEVSEIVDKKITNHNL